MFARSEEAEDEAAELEELRASTLAAAAGCAERMRQPGLKGRRVWDVESRASERLL